MPLAQAAKADSRERMAAPLFGIILENPVGNVRVAQYQVKKIIRGWPADGMGLSAQDPVTVRALQIDEKQGVAVMTLDIKQRLKGYMPMVVQIPAALDSSDLL
jgi:hypothetical protein